MNPLIQRYLPPTIVLGAALYFGWPPAPPLDLGDDIVKISSVRWRPSEITDVPLIQPHEDPFREVLVAGEKMEVEPETGKLVEVTRPLGPRPEVLQSGLLLAGIADTAGKRWAVVNGRARLVGDTVRTTDGEHRCQILAIESGHIVVQCQETVTEIRPLPAGSLRPVTATPVKNPAAPVLEPELGNELTPDQFFPEDLADVPPLPQA